MARVINLPRPIKPELINVGDTVVVTLPEDGGIVTRHEATVHSTQRHAGMVHLLTADRSVIARYAPGHPSAGVKYTLVRRADVVQEPLALFEELEQRLA